MGFLSVGRVTPLPSHFHPANPLRIAEDFGRDISAGVIRDQDGRP